MLSVLDSMNTGALVDLSGVRCDGLAASDSDLCTIRDLHGGCLKLPPMAVHAHLQGQQGQSVNFHMRTIASAGRLDSLSIWGVVGITQGQPCNVLICQDETFSPNSVWFQLYTVPLDVHAR